MLSLSSFVLRCPCLITTCTSLSILLIVDIGLSFAHQAAIEFIITICRSLPLPFILKLVLMFPESLCVFIIPLPEDLLLVLLLSVDLLDSRRLLI